VTRFRVRWHFSNENIKLRLAREFLVPELISAYSVGSFKAPVVFGRAANGQFCTVLRAFYLTSSGNEVLLAANALLLTGSRSLPKISVAQQEFLIDRSGDVGHHPRPKHLGFPLDLHPSESEIVDAVFQPEKSIRGEPVESCKLRYFNSFEFFDFTTGCWRNVRRTIPAVLCYLACAVSERNRWHRLQYELPGGPGPGRSSLASCWCSSWF
jgi:hypothetical protein